MTSDSAILYPATELAILSGPSSFGLSIFTFNPVFTPGPTTVGVDSKYFYIALTILLVTWGTTEHIIEPDI